MFLLKNKIEIEIMGAELYVSLGGMKKFEEIINGNIDEPLMDEAKTFKSSNTKFKIKIVSGNLSIARWLTLPFERENMQADIPVQEDEKIDSRIDPRESRQSSQIEDIDYEAIQQEIFVDDFSSPNIINSEDETSGLFVQDYFDDKISASSANSAANKESSIMANDKNRKNIGVDIPYGFPRQISNKYPSMQ